MVSMDAINNFIVTHAGLALAIGFILHFGKDLLRDFLIRDADAKLKDKDPSNDKLARLEQAGVTIIDKVPDPLDVVRKK